MTKHRRPLNRSITIGCVIFLLLLSVILSITNLTLHRNFVYQDYQTYITDILNYTKSNIDGDDLEECIKTETESEKYKKTLLFMDGLINNYHDIHYFYAILPLNTNETGNVMSVLSAERYEDRYENTEGNLYLGWISEDEFDVNTVKIFFEAMNSDKTIFFEEKTEWGTDYTGAIPIKNSKGESIAVLAVDIDISFINQSIWEYAGVNIGVISLLGIIFIIIFLVWSRHNITKPIRLLEESAVSFVDHSSGQRDLDALEFHAPEFKADNEIKSLSNAVIKMTKDMQEYVTEIISAEELAANMQELASHDALTGVRNKAAYDAEIKSITDTKVGIAIIDLNNLKAINDKYGHDKGDIAIKNLSEMVCDIFVHSPVFRIGGDEFAIILRNHDYDYCKNLVNKLNKRFDDFQKDDTLEPWDKTSAAIGVAFFEEGDDMESLFKRADQEMYKRKKEMKEKMK